MAILTQSKTLSLELDICFIDCSVLPGQDPTGSVSGSSCFTRDLFPGTTGDQVHEADCLELLELVCVTNTLPCMHVILRGSIKSCWPLVYHVVYIVYHVVFWESLDAYAQLTNLNGKASSYFFHFHTIKLA